MTTTLMIAPNQHVARPSLRSAFPAAVVSSTASAYPGMWCTHVGANTMGCATAPMFAGRTHVDTTDTIDTANSVDSKRVDPGTLRGGLT